MTPCSSTPDRGRMRRISFVMVGATAPFHFYEKVIKSQGRRGGLDFFADISAKPPGRLAFAPKELELRSSLPLRALSPLVGIQ